jgi:hypothetical protein
VKAYLVAHGIASERLVFFAGDSGDGPFKKHCDLDIHEVRAFILYFQQCAYRRQAT